MALLSSSTNIRSGTSPIYQRAIYWFNTTAGSPLYIHLKTNIPANSNQMFYIEAEGYNYGRAQPILCSWTGYPWSGSGTTINVSLTNFYPGMAADGVYQSSDNYVVLRASSITSNYYNGFIINAVMANPNGFGFQVSILASVQTDQSGAYY
jgi:hypothetical protein